MINKIINSQRNKTSHGYDGISDKILKASAPFIISPLTYIFNRVLSTGVFPDRLKYSEVQPLFKKGGKNEIANYRPISLLPSLSKIIEKIIYKWLISHLNENNILTKEQFGFKKISTTNMATYALLNNIQQSLDKKWLVGGIFCDLQKAFDCVNHNILLEKMEYYGITGTAHKLMQSYLDNRYQRTKIKGKSSNTSFLSWEPVKHGVPQGSVLGPLMFLIYINDFPKTINKVATAVIFADDTSIIIKNNNKIDFKNALQQTIIEMSNWFRSNLLTLNYDKTHFLQFLTTNRNEMQQQTVTSNLQITNINSTRFLGLKIDSTLTWRDHVIELTPKLNKACYVIRTLMFLRSPDILRMVYFSYFHSLVSYGIIFWGNSHSSINIFRIQKRIIRIMTNSNKHDTCRPLFKQLRILPLPSQYIFSLLLFVVTNKELFLLNSQIHNIHTRHSDNLHLPQTGLTLVQKGVLFSGCKIYNHLPLHIKNISNKVPLFKSKLRNLLLQYVFYSVDEYYQQSFDNYVC
jgi:hypothetical protein